ncbi:hypothetical protein MLD52_21435 [Puniceicoccaceae bacterium K14]|nr:hypothetical protein [Puniceicoccaceae bacterium K14]
MSFKKKTICGLSLIAVLSVSLYAQSDVAYSPTLGMERLDFDAHERATWGLGLTTQETLSSRVVSYAAGVVTLDREHSGSLSVDPSSGDSQYYLVVKTGAMAGAIFPIASNSGSNVTLAGGSSSVSGHPFYQSSYDLSGQLVQIKPYWTVKTLFEGESIQPEDAKEWIREEATLAVGDTFSVYQDVRLGVSSATQENIVFDGSAEWHLGSATEDWSNVSFAAGTPLSFMSARSTQRWVYVLGAVSDERFYWDIPAVAADEWLEFYRAIPLAEMKSLSSADASLFMTQSDSLQMRTDEVTPLPFSDFDAVAEEFYYLSSDGNGDPIWVSVGQSGQVNQADILLSPGSVYRFRIKGDLAKTPVIFD